MKYGANPGLKAMCRYKGKGLHSFREKFHCKMISASELARRTAAFNFTTTMGTWDLEYKTAFPVEQRLGYEVRSEARGLGQRMMFGELQMALFFAFLLSTMGIKVTRASHLVFPKRNCTIACYRPLIYDHPLPVSANPLRDRTNRGPFISKSP